MFKKKEQEQQEIMCDVILRKKLLVHRIWDYKNDKNTIEKKNLKQKGFTLIKTETTNNIYGTWEEEIWEKEIGTQLY